MFDSNLDARLLRNFIGTSAIFKRAIELTCQYARSKSPILITGETGTGKELLAHAAHYLSDRRSGSFVPVNCGALPDALIESELFGHSKGAFTDASRARAGLVREADGGTLFLDEIEALSPRGQVTLLRFLQDASYRSVGEEQTRHADVRLIAASNVDLHESAARGAFRPDLLFRLDVLSVQLPPLRARAGDIAQLAPHLLAKAAAAEGGAAKSLSTDALALLCACRWPGNVRELEHVLLRAHLLCDGGVIDACDLSTSNPSLASSSEPPPRFDRDSLREQKLQAVRDVERRFVEQALSLSSGNISAAARLCNMERAVLSKMAKKCRRSDAAASARHALR